MISIIIVGKITCGYFTTNKYFLLTLSNITFLHYLEIISSVRLLSLGHKGLFINYVRENRREGVQISRKLPYLT